MTSMPLKISQSMLVDGCQPIRLSYYADSPKERTSVEYKNSNFHS